MHIMSTAKCWSIVNVVKDGVRTSILLSEGELGFVWIFEGE
jgi:hypothetical protein